MALHFSREEFAERQKRASARIVEAGLDGLLIFRQESMYYLTGYDTSGYHQFQGMYLGADGALALVTRAADLRQARITSVIEDVRLWVDRQGVNPADSIRAMLESFGCRGKRIGVEYHAYGLTGQRCRQVDQGLAGFCTLVDASDLVMVLRLVKSPAELDYVRGAGRLVDEALATSVRMTAPGASVGAIYGAMQNVILSGDGDPSASRWPMGRGEEALLVRYHTGHGAVAANDQVMFEPAAAYRHYHAVLMYNIITGKVDPRHRDMFEACREALDACEETLRAGKTQGDVFEAHARVFTKAGYKGHFLHACGYALGATYPPTWVDSPMCFLGNPQVLAPGMVFFLHMILLNSDTGLSMALGETAVVTDDGCEPISHAPTALIVK